MEFSFEVFRDAIVSRNFALNEYQINQASRFAVILHRENLLQNLTRITGVDAFVNGHLLDVIELFHVEQLGTRVLDIGSGCGVPGLLAAAIDLDTRRTWFLADSEISKADYLKSAALELGLERVTVFSKRAEEVSILVKPDTIIARAVGSVEKICAWVWNCSTWNNLVLFKSKGWEEEWKQAKLSRFGKKLTATQLIEYSSEDKYRILVSLKRN